MLANQSRQIKRFFFVVASTLWSLIFDCLIFVALVGSESNDFCQFVFFAATFGSQSFEFDCILRRFHQPYDFCWFSTKKCHTEIVNQLSRSGFCVQQSWLFLRSQIPIISLQLLRDVVFVENHENKSWLWLFNNNIFIFHYLSLLFNSYY